MMQARRGTWQLTFATLVIGIVAWSACGKKELPPLSAIVDAAWSKGAALDLAGLIGAVQKPPFDKVGVFDVETFYPAKERLELAMAVNNLPASPGFGVCWKTNVSSTSAFGWRTTFGLSPLARIFGTASASRMPT